MDEQQSAKRTFSLSEKKAQIEENVQRLIDTIDKNSDGWDAIVNARDILYKEFLSGGTSDNSFNTKKEEFIKCLDVVTLQATAQFPFENPVSYEDCQMLILAGVEHEWEKRVEQVKENIQLGEAALTAAYVHVDLEGLPNLLFDPLKSSDQED